MRVKDCLAQSTDENSSPLLRLAGSVADHIYPLLRDFLDARISQMQLNASLVQVGVSEDAVFADNVQLLLDHHSLHGSVNFGQLRSVVMKSVVAYPVKTVRAVSPAQSPRKRRWGVERVRDAGKDWLQPEYEHRPLDLFSNHMLPPKLKFERARRHGEVKMVLHSVKRKPPVAVSLIQVVPKSLLSRAGNYFRVEL